MIHLELSQEMFDFFLQTMRGKKKRLLRLEPPKELQRYSHIGSGLALDSGEPTSAEKLAALEDWQKWKLMMDRTEKAIDLLESL